MLQLDSDEPVLINVNRSVWGVALAILGMAITVFGLLAALFYISRFRDDLVDVAPLPMLILVAIAVAALLLLISYIHIRIFFGNTLAVTSESIVQRLQTTLFNPKISQLRLDDVQDVTVAQNGVLANAFNFGTITVETAGEQSNFIFAYAKDPQKAARIIIEAQEALAESPRPVTPMPPTPNQTPPLTG